MQSKINSVLFIILVITLQTSASSLNACHQIYTDPIPSVFYRKVQVHHSESKALRDPLMDEARHLQLEDDYKTLSDMSLRKINSHEQALIYKKAKIIEQTKGRREAVKFLLYSLYEKKAELLPVNLSNLKPHWSVNEAPYKEPVEHIEKMWQELVKQTPQKTTSSLIPMPNPILIPGARFQEGYYWDSFFAFPALLRTGRENLVKGQIDNFLFLIKNYNLIPNGTRDYYLSRSQPPLLAEMVRLYIEHRNRMGTFDAKTKKWLVSEVYPLIKKDYENFWMNPNTRYDQSTGLNHHFDKLNSPRPERHSSDIEENIAKTYRDVRAEAESGKDFTSAFDGEATNYAGVMLNSVLFSVEKNLAWLAEIAQRPEEKIHFEEAAKHRQQAMNQFLWDKRSQVYRDYNYKTRKLSSAITADIFATLNFNIANSEQAQSIVKNFLPKLERRGGLMSAETESGKQWDAPYGWAPHHYFAINGLKNYGFSTESKRLATKWVTTVNTIYYKTGKMIEKIDATSGDIPFEEGDKYPTQDGFLWTNGVYIWSLTDILGIKLISKTL